MGATQVPATIAVVTDEIDQEGPVGDTLHVKANANVTLGGVFVAYGEEGDVPDGVETRSAATLGLIDILDDPHAPADAPSEESGETDAESVKVDDGEGDAGGDADPEPEAKPAHAQHAAKKAAKRPKG